jgi:Cof subfamily protein (haloacid dehalogenase superfamily)
MIATDIDGTILSLNSAFTEGVKYCISDLQSRGIKVVLVTGRMNKAALLIRDELGLKTPVVSYQGGLINDGGNVLYERYLSETQAKKIIEWAKSENIHINLYNDDILYSEKDDEEVKRYSLAQHIDYEVKSFNEIKLNKVNKILAIDFNNPEKIDKYEKELPNVFPELYIVKSTPYFLEFSNPEGSKCCAVRFLQKYWGIKESETLTIGDQNNDIALLEAGGVRVAMGNATEELKSVANYITDTVANDGFVKAIQKFVI